MARTRMVNTKFWSDGFISELNPLDRYLFLYFLTNEHTNISGIYEITLKTISFETGLTVEMVNKMFKRLHGKIHYTKGWVCILNFPKHQARGHESVIKGIELAIKSIPKEIYAWAVKIGYGSEGGGRGVASGNYDLDLDYDLDSDLDLNTPKGVSVEVKKEKVSYGELNSVKLTPEEYSKLVERYGENNIKILIFELDTYIASKGKKYKSHYATILNWANRKIFERQKNNNKYNVGTA